MIQTDSYSKGIGCFSSTGKRSVNKADDTLTCITEIKNEWRHTSTDQYEFPVCKGTPLPLFKLPLEGQRIIVKVLRHIGRRFELDTLQTREEANH